MVALLLVIALPLVGAGSVFRQVHVISRHGSRYPSIGSSNDEAVDLQDSLSTLGEDQMFSLGLWLKDRYAGKINKPYNAHRVRLDSSDTDYTVVSAYALAQGLFDGASRDPHNESELPYSRYNVPVHTIPSKNDVVFRAHDKCKAFNQSVEALTTSESFQKLHEKYHKLFDKIVQMPEFVYLKDKETKKLVLQDIWKAYDVFEFAKAECSHLPPSAKNHTTACRLVSHLDTALTPHEWRELQDVTHAVELLKYNRDVAGTLLGGPLLLRMTELMGRSEFEADANDKTEANAKFFLYSAHYETILAVLAAIGESPVDKVIPAYSSALMFELHSSVSSAEPEYFVKIYYKAGGNDTAVQLGTVCSKTSLECPIYQFVTYVDNQIASKNWCQDCGNDSADVCLVSKGTAASNASGETGPVSSTWRSANDSAALPFGTTLIGVLMGFTGALLLQWSQANRKLRKLNEHDASLGETPLETADCPTVPAGAAFT